MQQTCHRLQCGKGTTLLKGGAAGGFVGTPDLGRIMTSPIEMACPAYGLHDGVAHTAVNHRGLWYHGPKGAKRER